MEFILTKAWKKDSKDTNKQIHLENVKFPKSKFGYCWWNWIPRISSSLKTRYKHITCEWFNYSFSYMDV